MRERFSYWQEQAAQEENLKDQAEAAHAACQEQIRVLRDALEDIVLRTDSFTGHKQNVGSFINRAAKRALKAAHQQAGDGG